MNMNLEEQLDYFKLYLQKQGKSSNTILSYLCSLRLFFSLYNELNVDNLHAYRDYLLSHYRINTVNTRIHGINRFLDCLSALASEQPESRQQSVPSSAGGPAPAGQSHTEAVFSVRNESYLYKEAFHSESPVSDLSVFRLEPLRLLPSPEKICFRLPVPEYENSSAESVPSALTASPAPSFSSPDSGCPGSLPVLSDGDSFKLNPVKTQQRTYLDTVISERDYEKFKRRLKKDKNYYWYFVVRFLGATGARISELLQIKMENLKSGHLDLYSKGGKIRRLYLPRRLCDEALPWFESKGIKSGFIFLNHHGQVISSRGIAIQLKQLAIRYRIDPDTIYPHSFRHRFAKNFLKKFNDISLLADLMGHDSIETTRIYLTRSSVEQKELLDRIITW